MGRPYPDPRAAVKVAGHGEMISTFSSDIAHAGSRSTVGPASTGIAGILLVAKMLAGALVVV
jgi:hypothetical protein